MSTSPAVIFVTIAREVPQTAPDEAKGAHNSEKAIHTACPVCLMPLRPNQVHIPGGFECRAALGEA